VDNPPSPVTCKLGLGEQAMEDEKPDPLLEAKLDRALLPYVGLLPPEILAEFRDHLADFMTTHPAMERMLARLRPPPVVAESGEVPTSNEKPSEAADPKRASRRGQ